MNFRLPKDLVNQVYTNWSAEGARAVSRVAPRCPKSKCAGTCAHLDYVARSRRRDETSTRQQLISVRHTSDNVSANRSNCGALDFDLYDSHFGQKNTPQKLPRRCFADHDDAASLTRPGGWPIGRSRPYSDRESRLRLRTKQIRRVLSWLLEDQFEIISIWLDERPWRRCVLWRVVFHAF